MTTYSLNIEDKTKVFEGVQRLINSHSHSKINSLNENNFNFQIGSLVSFVISGIPDLIEGSINFERNESDTMISINFTRTKLFYLIIVQSIIFFIFGAIFWLINNAIIALLAGISLVVLADVLDYYYVITLEKNFVNSIKAEYFLHRTTGPKIIYTIGTIVGLLLLVLIVLAK